jgi:hypothetical protein
MVETQEWVSVLEKGGLLNLFEIPHFGQSKKIDSCVKVLLRCDHGGTLWLDPLVSIDTTLIVHITGL